jgi:hypothetical protein
MRNADQIENRLRQIIRQLSGKIETEGLGLIPEVAIRGHGCIYCYAPDKRRIVKITRGIKAYVLDEDEDELGRVLIYTWTGQMVEIEPKELLHTGFD